jgi:PilZ domain
MISAMSMSFPGGQVPRLGDRTSVDQVGVLTVKRQGRLGRVKEVSVPVQILDVSMSGASVRAPADAELVPRQLAVFTVGDASGAVRIVWIRPDDTQNRMCGVQFLDPRPAFLPTLYRWLGRETETGPSER